ncbi:MAG: hypothetical protein WCO06_00805 [Candidatus Roizmanbacteria bacterium]
MQNVYLAQINPTTIQDAMPFTKKMGTIADLTNLLVPIAVTGAGIVLFIMFIYAGFMYMSSEGNAEKLKKAQSLLMMSLIGFALVIGSFIIIQLLKLIFQVNIPI